MNLDTSKFEQACEVVDGQRAIRQETALRLLGLTRTSKLVKHGKIIPIVLRVPPCQGASIGKKIYWPLDQVLVLHLRYSSQRRRLRFNEHEQLVLSQSVGRKTVEQIAASINRSPEAVRHRIYLTRIPRSKPVGVLTIAQIARLVRRTFQCVRAWIVTGGLPSVNYIVGTKHRGVHLRDLRAWLIAHPNIADGVDPYVCSRLLGHEHREAA